MSRVRQWPATHGVQWPLREAERCCKLDGGEGGVGDVADSEAWMAWWRDRLRFEFALVGGVELCHVTITLCVRPAERRRVLAADRYVQLNETPKFDPLPSRNSVVEVHMVQRRMQSFDTHVAI